MVFHNEDQLLQVKAAILAKDPYFSERYTKLLAEADLLLAKTPDPVVNKTVIPPSGDQHDYLSFSPYGWPDKSKKDGLPWKPIDGVTNPVSRGRDTDYTRLSELAETLDVLTFTYYYSGNTRYSDKGLEHLRAWFVNPETRVNPNINYGQGVPGLTDGRPAGIIEWKRISSVVTALQIFDKGGVLPAEIKAGTRAWMERYLDWLTTSPLGKEADALPQNHSSWYDYQVVGLMIHLGRLDEAKARVEKAKTSRIAAQITPDGRQPRETGRTKSLHYSTMNLWALTNLTFMGRKLEIDLWEFETPDGRSLRQAYQFLAPYALGEREWTYQQITPGGAQAVIESDLKPLFSKASTLLKRNLVEVPVDGSLQLSPLDALKYPPLERLTTFKP